MEEIVVSMKKNCGIPYSRKFIRRKKEAYASFLY